MTSDLIYPNSADFAFTIIDDTDDSTLENTKPVYDLLESLGLRTTKSIWVYDYTGPSHYRNAETIEDPAYLEFVKDLANRGFEITWHCARMESSPRDITLRALDDFESTFGVPPLVHLNHGENLENLYWGVDRFDSRLLRNVYRLLSEKGAFAGHNRLSEYFWGDIAQERIRFTRNLTFAELNSLKVNPSIPYRDPNRPYSKYWFSSADAPDCKEFCNRITRPAIDRLARERGICLLSTHLGKGFSIDGAVQNRVVDILTYVSDLNGWFVPAGEILDWLIMHNPASGQVIPDKEWRRMQRTWLIDRIRSRMTAQSGTT